MEKGALSGMSTMHRGEVRTSFAICLRRFRATGCIRGQSVGMEKRWLELGKHTGVASFLTSAMAAMCMLVWVARGVVSIRRSRLVR